MSEAHFLVRLGGARSELMTPELVSAHVSYLHGLHDSEHLELCGPYEDGTAIIVLRRSGRGGASGRTEFVRRGSARIL